jgi:hypothetical protein
MFSSLTDMARMIVIALFPIILPSCMSHKGEAAFWENEREKIELTQCLQLAEYRLGLNESGDFQELERLQSLLSEMEVRLWNLQSDQSALINDIGRMEIRNAELCRTALEKQRARARGMNFASFSVRDGRNFTNVSVTGVDDSGVAIRHEHGAARLRYAELSDEQRLFFGLEEAGALVAEDHERREALAYELSIDLELEAMRERERKESADSIAERNNDFQPSRALMAASNYQHETRPLAQPARSFGSGSSYRRWYGYSGYRYRSVYSYVYRDPSVSNPFCGSPQPQGRVTAQSVVGPRVPFRKCPTETSSQDQLSIPSAP